MNEIIQFDLLENENETEFREKLKQSTILGVDKSWVLNKMREPGGCFCPLCSQHIQMYKRSITAAMAAGLILIYRYYQKHDLNRSIHIEGYLKRCRISSAIRGDMSKLRYWHLLRKKNKAHSGGTNRSGHYYLTGDGMAFVNGNLKVKKYCYVYNNRIWKFDGETIGIGEALKTKFNYTELMTAIITDIHGKTIIEGVKSENIIN